MFTMLPPPVAAIARTGAGSTPDKPCIRLLRQLQNIKSLIHCAAHAGTHE
jgi:hypothetical protein